MPTETVSAFRKIANTTVDRRVLLTGAVGAATIPLLAACSTGGGSGTKKTETFTFGSNASDPVPKKGYAYFVSGFGSRAHRSSDRNDSRSASSCAHSVYFVTCSTCGTLCARPTRGGRSLTPFKPTLPCSG